MRIFGTHAIREALQKSSDEGILYLVENHRNKKEFVSMVKHAASKVRVVLRSRYELHNMGATQGALLVTNSNKHSTYIDLQCWLREKSHEEQILILVLDHIQDAQNAGAIFRTAAVFNASLVISAVKRSAPENEYARKASSGAMSIVPSCKVSNIAEAVRMLKKHHIWTYSLDASGKSLSQHKLPLRCAFVLGNEHKGIAPLVVRECDDVCSIPMTLDRRNSIDSLNVSVSAGIACYEYRRTITKTLT